MNASRGSLVPTLALLLVGSGILVTTATGSPQGEASTSLNGADRAAAAAGISAAEDQPLATFQVELLELAIDSASAFPLHPHIKNRSRAQERVVAACFELEQPWRALAYAERILNWRRGMAYADLAYYLAQRGARERVDEFIGRALETASVEDEEVAQSWRQDRIKAKVAQTLTCLGREAEAEHLQQRLTESEEGKVLSARLALTAAEQFDARFAELREVLDKQGLDQVRNALPGAFEFYAGHYGDEGRRKRIEDALRTAVETLPLQVRFETAWGLAEVAAREGDAAHAREHLTWARGLVDGYSWAPEYEVVFTARLASALHVAGDEVEARALAERAWALFEAKGPEIVSIYRCETLLPLAEAYHALGDPASALRVYRRALKEATVNPNSRPTAEDLTELCCSLARGAVEPDAELWAELKAARAGLGDPW